MKKVLIATTLILVTALGSAASAAPRGGGGTMFGNQVAQDAYTVGVTAVGIMTGLIGCQ